MHGVQSINPQSSKHLTEMQHWLWSFIVRGDRKVNAPCLDGGRHQGALLEIIRESSGRTAGQDLNQARNIHQHIQGEVRRRCPCLQQSHQQIRQKEH